MENSNCKATTALGEQCQLQAGLSGYCHIHDPKKIEDRTQARKLAEEEKEKQWAKGQRIREVLEVIKSTCKAKGWRYRAPQLDQENWCYASITVEREFPSDGFMRTATAVIDLSVEKGVGIRISAQPTSHPTYGVNDLIDSVMTELGGIPWIEPPKKQAPLVSDEPLQRVIGLLRRFHAGVRQLKIRHENRPTLLINDEYDVQDLLQALLKSLFDDVRPEETTPSYAGGSSRVDFLLKKEKIVVEAKMASPKLKDKLIGEQLIIDIKRYQAHPDCKTLVCFVYDPGGYLVNPAALQSDLCGKHNTLEVRVVVAP